MKQELNTKIYFILKAFLYAFLSFVLLIGIIVFIGKFLNLPLLGIFLFICLCTLPIYFKKKIRRVFTKSVSLGFNNHSFIITIYKSNSNNNDVERKVVYAWNSIKAYKISVTRSNLTCLDIYLKNGGFKEFFFDDSETLKTSEQRDSIIGIFNSFITKYNSENSISEKITSSPGMLTTRIGTCVFVILGLLITTSIVLHIIHPNQSFAFLIIGFSIFISLIVKRITDKKNAIKENKSHVPGGY